MSIVGKILAETQFTEEIDGLPFVLRKVTAEIAAQVIGSKVLGLMRGGVSAKELPPEETIRITEGYLERCMISPKFGIKSSVEDDTVCLDDLVGFHEKILIAIFEKSGFDKLGKSDNS